MSTGKRKVKYRRGDINIAKGSVSRKKPNKTAILAAARKLNRTRTRKYIMYSILCIVMMQVVRFVVYEFIYAGSETPSGAVFTIIIYVQTGFMLACLGFLVASSVAYLNSLRK